LPFRHWRFWSHVHIPQSLTANPGIGRGFVEAYLTRPNHTVIGSIRDDASPEVAELRAFAPAEGSKLILIHIESKEPEDAVKAIKEVKAMGIRYIDVAIANAGGSPPIQSMDSVSASSMVDAFETNALGPLLLFQACKPLLKASKRKPKWVSISTGGGSIGLIGEIRSYIGPAYGASKAALNWLTA
jgi:NAD(P)-dependent dehydrogenase (short-subunit alcohol dehydrogenase family)